MTAHTDADNLRKQLQELAQTVDALADNLPAAKLYASTPTGRQAVADTQREIRLWLSALRACIREMERADRLLTKVLKKLRPWEIGL